MSPSSDDEAGSAPASAARVASIQLSSGVARAVSGNGAEAYRARSSSSSGGRPLPTIHSGLTLHLGPDGLESSGSDGSCTTHAQRQLSPTAQRPSPQLLSALHGTQTPPSASEHSTPSTGSEALFSVRTPPQLRRSAAGRIPPSFALERAALPASPPKSILRPRSLSTSSGGGTPARGPGRHLSPHVKQVNVTPPVGGQRERGSLLSLPLSLSAQHTPRLRALTADGLDDDESRALLLQPSRLRRSRASSSAAGTTPLASQLLTEEVAWSSITSRLLVYCASGVLFLLLFCFFVIAALRMVAHSKYDDRPCIAREATARTSASPETAPTALDRRLGYDSSWAPNYDPNTWDAPWIAQHVRRVLTSAASTSNATANGTAVALVTDDEVAARTQMILDAGSWLPHLRLHHFRWLGTHNSYHVASPLIPASRSHTHAPLPQQLGTYRHGVRQLELDIHIIASRKNMGGPSAPAKSSDGGFAVYRIQWLDDGTTCYCLSECLELINAWSRAHPNHFPITLTFEIKSQLWEDVDTGLRGVSCSDLEHLEREILKVFPASRLIRPIDVRGGLDSPHRTVRDALAEATEREAAFAQEVARRRTLRQPPPNATDYPAHSFGWPTLRDALGRIMIVWFDDRSNLAERLDCVVNNNAAAISAQQSPPSTEGQPSGPVDDAAVAATSTTPASSASTPSGAGYSWFHADNRLIFLAGSDWNRDAVSVLSLDSSSAVAVAVDAGALDLGLLLRTASHESLEQAPDPARFQAALQAGAHITTSDFNECRESKVRASNAEEEEEAAIAKAAGGHGRSMRALSLYPSMLLPALGSTPLLSSTLARVRNSSDSLYCEHLPSGWPFECNPRTAPFFCEAALQAARMQLQFAVFDEEKQTNTAP